MLRYKTEKWSIVLLQDDDSTFHRRQTIFAVVSGLHYYVLTKMIKYNIVYRFKVIFPIKEETQIK